MCISSNTVVGSDKENYAYQNVPEVNEHKIVIIWNLPILYTSDKDF